MTELPPIPPRPAWAAPPAPPAPPAGPPRPNKRQLKRWRYKANARRRAASEVVDPVEEANVARRVAEQFNARRPSPADQHREAVEDHYRHRGDRWRYGESGAE